MLFSKMFRFRRYRVFLISAALLTIILFRLSHTDDWESASPLDLSDHSGPEQPPSPQNAFETSLATTDQATKPVVDIEKLAHAADLSAASPAAIKTLPPTSTSVRELEAATPPKETLKPTLKPTPTEHKPLAATEGFQREDAHAEELHPQPPGKFEGVSFSPSASPIHWVKPTEHWPIPPGSRIVLPTGQPKKMPKIQYSFDVEPESRKTEREERLNKVKREFMKAWDGYKTKAWMHDELRPVTGESRDPFCGWAATLVDSLDTLWIMGLQDEFESAVLTVNTIDFTTSPRSDIPVFETTIRYLGGLLAAYDVSGGIYTALLDKAVELAEILIGAFDTPNRMPLLFYRWKPAFTSQPHRAATRANLAELGSLSMEFTRLAQLTKDSKYYDAVARVTDALEEFQNRGTKLPGIFPSDIDISGCNRSVPIAKHDLPTLTPSSNNADAKGYVPAMPVVVQESKPRKATTGEAENFELRIIPGQPSKGHIETIEYDSTSTESNRVTRREESIPEPGELDANQERPRYSKNASKPPPTMTETDWDCIPQGLSGPPTGPQYFSMGGGQDSTYEYFPKQYLLLGGLEDKYRTMYLKTMEAVRKHLLFRPMIPDNRDILFSGRVMIPRQEGAQSKFEPEITHLTCFLGGMVGLGAKLFNIESDIDIAKKLADGCVWAYEVSTYGVMPELSKGIPCEDASDCSWSEERWWRWLDPLVDQREQDIKEFEENQARLKVKEEADRLAVEAELTLEDTKGISQVTENDVDDTSLLNNLQDIDVDSPPPISTRYEENLVKASRSTDSSKEPLQRRAFEPPEPFGREALHTDPQVSDAGELKEDINSGQDRMLPTLTQSGVTPTKVPSGTVPTLVGSGIKAKMPTGPKRPLSHEEYVKGRIERDGLLPGFSDVQMNYYILRPEAIESVWYMYRITGDPVWQEKGWHMFESIINITSTQFGHTAVKPVTGPKPPTYMNEMESFWLAETLKYFYLLYATPDTISLDEWVLNTEAHPFRRPDVSA